MMASMEIIFQRAKCRLGTAPAQQTAESAPRAAVLLLLNVLPGLPPWKGERAPSAFAAFFKCFR